MAQLFVLPFQVPFKSSTPLGLAKLYFYAAGTTTHQAVYTTPALSVAHPQPVEADADGVFPVIYLNPAAASDYRIQLKTQGDVLVPGGDVDNYPRRALSQTDIDTYTFISTRFKYDITAAEIAAGVTPTYYYIPNHLSDGKVRVKRYGAVGDGVTNDTTAIRNAQLVLEQCGGGELEYENGKAYLMSTVSTYTVRVPAAAANYQPADESHQYHVLIANKSNIKWNLNGSKLKSSITNGGEMFILDGVRNFEVENGEVESVYAHDVTGAVTTAGMNAFGVTSQTRNSFNIKFKNVIATNVYCPVYCFGDAASSYRVRGVEVDNLYHTGGHYTLAFHNNGDSVTAQGVQSIDTLRDYFAYGVVDHDVEMYSETGVSGFTSLIKAYDADTKQIRYKLYTKKNVSQPNVILQSQHAPAVQANPCRLIGITVDVNNKGTSGLGPAVGFEYYRDAVLTATSSNNIFTGIKLAGIHEQPPVVSVTQNSLTANGTLDTDDLVLVNGSINNTFNRTGLIDSKQLRTAFTPVLKINASAVGITYTTAIGEYWRDGQWIEFLARITLSNKGASVGAVTIDLPIQTGDTNTVNPSVRGSILANGAALTSPLVGFVQLPGTTLSLQHQGAAGTANITDANLTNTTDMLLHVRYLL